jgi:hypothetical protein
VSTTVLAAVYGLAAHWKEYRWQRAPEMSSVPPLK